MSELQSSATSNSIDPRLCTNPVSLPFCSYPAKTPTPITTPSTTASSTLLSILTTSIPATSSSIKIPTTTSAKAPSASTKIPTTTSEKVPATTSVKIPPFTTVKTAPTSSVRIPTTTSVKIPTTTSVKIPTTTQYITTSTTTTSTKFSTVTSSQTTMILQSVKPSNSAPKVGAGSPSDGLQVDSVPTANKNQGQDDPAPTGNETTPSPIFSSITPSAATTSSPSSIPPPPVSSSDPPVSSKRPISVEPPVSSDPPTPSTDPTSEPAKPPPATSSSALPSSSSSADAETGPQKSAPSANKDSSKTTSSADFEALAVSSGSSTAAPTEAPSKAAESASTSDEPNPNTTSTSAVSVASAEVSQDTDQPNAVPSASLTGLSSALPAAITPTLSEILNPSNTMINSLGNNNPSTLVLASGTKSIPTGSTSLGPAEQPIAPPGTAQGSAAGTQPAGGQETGNPDLKLQNADKSTSTPPTGVIVGTAFGGFAAIAVLVIFIWLYRRRAQRRQQGNEPLTPLNGPAGGMTQGEGGSWGESGRSMQEVQPNPRRLTLVPPGSSSSNNPFSDANAVDKQPMRGILKAPVFEPFDFSLETAAVGVASTTDVAVPPVPPRSRARTVGHRSSQSFSTPTPPSRPQSSRHGSSLSLGQFTEKRDKFRSDPFDLEIDTSMIPKSLTPQVTQNPRASSIYSSQAPNRSSRYTSGITISTLSDSDSPITGPAPTWDSPTLGNAELSKNGKKWPDNAFGVGQAL